MDKLYFRTKNNKIGTTNVLAVDLQNKKFATTQIGWWFKTYIRVTSKKQLTILMEELEKQGFMRSEDALK